MLKVFKNSDLVPVKWKHNNPATPFYVFNPTLVKAGNYFAMTYRVVDEIHKTRRIASCKLDKNFDIIGNSIIPFSDLVKFQKSEEHINRSLEWHADPRYFWIKGKLYLLWNDGSVKPQNNQFLIQVNPDTLEPEAPARRLVRLPNETRIEKNWQIFESGSNVYAIYSFSPLCILKMNLDGDDDIICQQCIEYKWGNNYEGIYGEIRGGAQPVPVKENLFLAIVHSSFKEDGKYLKYVPCFIQKESRPPFKITHVPVRPLSIEVSKKLLPNLPKLNNKTTSVIYPCGLALDGNDAIVSFGINDEACAVKRIPIVEISSSMEPYHGRHEYKNGVGDYKIVSTNDRSGAVKLEEKKFPTPLFWWNAQGKRFDPGEGGRLFETGNVGDIASKLIIESIGKLETYIPKERKRKMLGIGSILSNAATGDLVWGSGIKGTATGFKEKVDHLSVYAVRGPLTLDFLRQQGISTSKVSHLFDPGCLAPIIYKNELSKAGKTEKSGFRIIPHYKDDLILRKQYPNFAKNFLSVDMLPLPFIEQILSTELVISSSLHGIIFAESLGIPAMWLAPINGEDELKYYDYYYGTNRYAVKRFTSIEQALRGNPMALPRFNFEAYLKTFPHKELQILSCESAPEEPAIASNKFSSISNKLSKVQNNLEKKKFTEEKHESSENIDNQASLLPASLSISKFMTALRNSDKASLEIIRSLISNTSFVKDRELIQLAIQAIDFYPPPKEIAKSIKEIRKRLALLIG